MITTYDRVEPFLQRVQAPLEEHEAANNLMLGIALRLKNQPGWVKSAPYFATVEEDSKLLLAAIWTPPQRMIVTAFAEDIRQASEQLVRSLLDGGWPIPGVLGPNETTRQVAEAWERITGRPVRKNMSERAYQLLEVIPPPPVPGRARLAGPDDIETIGRWVEAFREEAVPQDAPYDGKEWAAPRIASRSVYLWDNAQPVAMALAVRPIAHSITIGTVYTPPEQRNRGYASALVAEVSRLQLEAGFQFTTLFTNLANPTSNSIYMKIGYRPVCDYQEYLFTEF